MHFFFNFYNITHFYTRLLVGDHRGALESMIVFINELTTVNGAVNSNDNLGKVFLFFENTEGKDTMVHTNPRETFYISNFERRSRSAKFSFFKRSISCRRPMFCNVQ